MILLEETTKWGDNTPNHTYILESEDSFKMLGYIRRGEYAVQFFSKPLMFDKRNRTFKTLPATSLIHQTAVVMLQPNLSRVLLKVTP